MQPLLPVDTRAPVEHLHCLTEQRGREREAGEGQRQMPWQLGELGTKQVWCFKECVVICCNILFISSGLMNNVLSCDYVMVDLGKRGR